MLRPLIQFLPCSACSDLQGSRARAFSFAGPRTTRMTSVFALPAFEADAREESAFAVLTAQIRARNRCSGMKMVEVFVPCHHFAPRDHAHPKKRKVVGTNHPRHQKDGHDPRGLWNRTTCSGASRGSKSLQAANGVV